MAANITIAGATYSDVPSITCPKQGGGTAIFAEPSGVTATAADVTAGKYFIDSSGTLTEGTNTGGGGTGGITQDANGYLVLSDQGGGGGGPWNWRGDNATIIDQLGSATVNLDDTDFPTWTPSTSAHVLQAAATLTTFSANMADYEYAVRCLFDAHYEYDPGTTMQAAVTKTTAIYYIFMYRYPTNLTTITSGNWNTFKYTSYSVEGIEYYTTAGVQAWYTSMSGGVYCSALPTVTPSSTTSDTPTITVKTPKISVVCHNSYFSPTSAGAIDEENSWYRYRFDLYRMDKGTLYNGMWQELSDLYDGNL